jgi:hypothetical protein
MRSGWEMNGECPVGHSLLVVHRRERIRWPLEVRMDRLVVGGHDVRGGPVPPGHRPRLLGQAEHRLWTHASHRPLDVLRSAVLVEASCRAREQGGRAVFMERQRGTKVEPVVVGDVSRLGDRRGLAALAEVECECSGRPSAGQPGARRLR